MQTTRLKKIMTTRGSNFVAPLIACVTNQKGQTEAAKYCFHKLTQLLN